MKFHILLFLIFSITTSTYAELAEFDSGPGNAKIFRIEALEKYVKAMREEVNKLAKDDGAKLKEEIEKIKSEIEVLKNKESSSAGLKVIEERLNKLELKHEDDMKKMQADLRNFKLSMDQSLLDLSNKILQRIQIFEKYLQKPNP